jgi:small-conductance mechanosensitive channel
MVLIPTALAAIKTEDANIITTDLFGNLVLGAIILIVTFFLATFLRAWIRRLIEKKQGDQHKETKILYGRVVFALVMSIGTMIALTVIGAPLEWFSGGLGLGIAFALRGILANFFAGMMLLSNNKFNLGDFVALDPDRDGRSAVNGTIVDIQSRVTSLRGIDGGETTVPNIKMLESSVMCYTKNPIRRHAIQIGIGYQENIKEVSDLILATIATNKDIQPEPAAVVLIKEIGDNAVILEIRFWTVSASKWWITKSEITRNIFDALNQSGINIPYPVRTLRVDEASSSVLTQHTDLLDKLGKIEKAKLAGSQ